MLTSSVSKVARTATESAVKYGGIASQKVSEMASTVTDKVCIFLCFYKRNIFNKSTRF